MTEANAELPRSSSGHAGPHRREAKAELPRSSSGHAGPHRREAKAELPRSSSGHAGPHRREANAEHPAHAAGRRSREAVQARDKEAWLAVFAEDAIVEDPIGPSAFDPDGKGHRGRDAISAFWDMAIANTDKIEFDFRDTYQCGHEEANVGRILITTGEYQITAEGVFTYQADREGKLVALRAYWEMDRAAATARKIS